MEKALRKYLRLGEFGIVPEQRSRNMRAIRGTGNRTTETRLRLALARAGITGWRVRPLDVLGSPDFAFDQSKLAVFTDGCFWHGCPECRHAPIKSNRKYWEAKVERNRARDKITTRKLHRSGWRVLRLWEHELRFSLGRVVARIARALDRARSKASHSRVG